MKIITVDGKVHEVKYMQNKEKLKYKLNTAVYSYPNFTGSDIHKNSAGSNIFTVVFAIHKSKLVELNESIKKHHVKGTRALNVSDSESGNEYNDVKNIILIHEQWGELRGEFLDEIVCDTSSQADVTCSGVFQIQSPDEPTEQQDVEQENAEAELTIDNETVVDGELDEIDKPALLQLAEDLTALYEDIQNSAVVAAFNDLKSALNDAILNYQKVMNAVKKIMALPGKVLSSVTQFKQQIQLFKDQAAAIRRMPALTANMFKFNMRVMSYNLSQANRIPFIRKQSLLKKSGVKTAPIN